MKIPNFMTNLGKLVMRVKQTHQTHSVQEYNECQLSAETKRRLLLDCSDQKSGSDFILKVSQFSEISQLPTFHRNAPVYFLTAKSSQDEAELTHLPAESEQADSTRSIGHDRNQSTWTRYRLLFIPGILGLLTMIGIQGVICALWKRRYARAQNLHHQHHQTEYSQSRTEKCGPWDCDVCGCAFCCTRDSATSESTNHKHPSRVGDEPPDRSKSKHVEFLPDRQHACSKSHSHLGIGTMPKHLIAQPAKKPHSVLDPDLTMMSHTWQNAKPQSTYHYAEPAGEQSHPDRAYPRPADGDLSQSDCVRNLQRCCTDRQRCTPARIHIASAQPCIFMDDCTAYIVPVSSMTLVQTTQMASDACDDLYDEKVINISV
ncbi:unnamed protein product [Echinostoma caproni]|uniref:C2H2-type domain-containing protein n=1 Tax=Echinostoma caproni TaxID=27848 RepID=A0A183AB28_9TREM|nr:unnamed protein product [Echinostoma caproni]